MYGEWFSSPRYSLMRKLLYHCYNNFQYTYHQKRKGGNAAMPIISNCFGIIIRMFFNEHAPPHFHVEYAEYKASVNIQTLEVIEGKLSRRALELVLDWAELHQKELLEDWELCRQHLEPKEIEPLK